MIEHDNGPAAGLQHPMNFVDGRLDVRRVMQHAMRVNDVKRFVLKVQLFGIGDAKIANQAMGREVLSRQIDRRVSQINPGIDSAGVRKLRAVSANTATNLQYPQSARGG